MPRLYLNILVGERAAEATSVLATADPEIVQAVVDAVIARLGRPELRLALEKLNAAGGEFPS